MRGRFAPSPTGPLHLGSLRTAMVAWLAARAAGSELLLRVEDLDPVASRPEHEAGQRADLTLVGLDWDGAVVRQSARGDRYAEALATLARRGLVYRCWCTRREVQEAAAAPHGRLPEGAYPGTCRRLSAAEIARRERSSRPAALRVAAAGAVMRFDDRLSGPVEGGVDDFVVRRNDGTPAYQLAVVVDDADQGVEEVVRGDDLLDSTPRQLWLAQALGLAPPRSWLHVPLVVGPDGVRLAKRHGSITLADLAARGIDAAAVRSLLATSLGLAHPGEPVAMADLIPRFEPAALPRIAWTVPPTLLA